jgi:hypothetical protein
MGEGNQISEIGSQVEKKQFTVCEELKEWRDAT